MGIYGHQFDQYKSEDISVEEAIDIFNTCNEALVDLYESMEESEETLTEGANLEIAKIFSQYKKDVKGLKKKYKVDYKYDKEQAIKDLDEINTIIGKTIKDIKKVDADNVSSAILGSIYSIILDAAIFAAGIKGSVAIAKGVGAVTKSFLATQLTASAGGYATGAVSGSKLGKQIASLIANYKKFKDGKISAAEYLNLYRGEVIQTLEQTRNWNNGLKVAIRDQIKKQKEKK